MVSPKNQFRRGGPRTPARWEGVEGFTLLEVMIALAIMASVIMTVLGTVNFQLGILANERDNTAFVLLARAKMAELMQPGKSIQASDGTLAPAHPELTWQAELFPTEIPMLQKLVVRVRRAADKREVALERYIPK
ncbi:MAG TPA: prepilin-type N-terminal cleavage/methylation domain-containing protein [Desulfuromonadaceae bacterium]